MFCWHMLLQKPHKVLWDTARSRSDCRKAMAFLLVLAEQVGPVQGLVVGGFEQGRERAGQGGNGAEWVDLARRGRKIGGASMHHI